jgi:hypothetical protein
MPRSPQAWTMPGTLAAGVATTASSIGPSISSSDLYAGCSWTTSRAGFIA